MKTLVFYGGDNLQNSKFSVSSETARSATSTDVQAIPVARGSGATVVNSRLEAKQFSLSGYIKTSPGTNLQKSIADFDTIFNIGDKILRFVPEYSFIADAQDATGYTVSGDASNLRKDSDNFNFLAGSLAFDMSITLAGGGVIENSSLTAVDISGYSNPNFEFTLNLPDRYGISKVTLRVGNDSSNYYEANFLRLTNGRNMLSVSKSTMTQTGTVDDTAIDYFYIELETTSVLQNKVVNFDGLYIAEEDRIRNYRCYKTGGTERDDGHFWVDSIPYSGLSFICPDGYGTSTHAVEMFNLTGQTSNSNTNSVTLEGSTNLLPEYTLIVNSQTNLQKVTITNETVGQSLNFDRNWQNGDVFTFGGLDVASRVNSSILEFQGQIPDHRPGANRIRLSFALSTAVSQSFLTYNSNRSYSRASGSNRSLLAQSFVAAESGTITEIKLHIPFLYNSSIEAGWIVADNSGEPGSVNPVSPDFTISQSSGSTFSTANILNPRSVTNTNTYWIVLVANNYVNQLGISRSAYWSYNTAGGVGGVSKGNDGTGWSSALTGDHVYELTITPSVSIDYDWSGAYYKLYV